MKARVVSLIVLLFLMLMILPVALGANSDATQATPPLVDCHPIVRTHEIVVRCSAAGVTLVDTTAGIPTVTLPPIPGPTKTIYVPGPIKTVHAPGATQTVTATVSGGGMHTVTAPSKTKTEYVTESAQPNPTVTKTVNARPTRQPDQTSDTVVPNTDEPVVKRIFERIDTPAKIIGISTLTLLLLIGLGLLVLWLGYILGYKDADRENANFMAALSDKMLIRGKHR